MANEDSSSLRDCAVVSAISIFGLSYFSVLAAQILLFHFPSTRNEIIGTFSATIFSAGVIIWCLFTILSRVILGFQRNNAATWQKLELGSVLLLIWTSTLPAIILLFEAQPSLRLGYLVILTIVSVGSMLDLFICDPDISVVQIRFPYHCVSLGLLSLAPAIQALTETGSTLPTLAIEFLYMAARNSLAAIFFLIGPLERTNAVSGLRPSLYAMHLVLMYSIVSYSKALMQIALR